MSDLTDRLTNRSVFDRVASASAIEEQKPKGIFEETAEYVGYEPMLRRREADNTFAYVWDNQDEDAEAIINLTDHYSKKYGVSRSDALFNLDGYIRDDMGKPVPKKAAWQQIYDGYKEGRLTDRIGRLANQLMWATDDAEKRRIQLEIDNLEQQMPNHEYDRGGFTGAVTSASNLFGTMIRPLGVSVVTSLATAGLGTIPAVAAFAKDAPRIAAVGSKILSALPTFNETRKVETGLIYKDMLENGVPEQIAKKNAIAHGIIAGALETASIEVILARFPFMKKITQNAILKMTARERMAQGAVKSLGQIIAKNAVSIPMSMVSEVATEVWQEQSAIYFEKRADLQSIDDKELAKIMADKHGEFSMYFDEEFRKAKRDYYVSDEYAKEVKDRIWNVMKQTAEGMLVFGLVGGGVNTVSDISTVAKKDIPYRRTYTNLEKLKTDVDKLREKRNQLRDELNADPNNAEKKAAYEKANAELATREQELNMTDEQREYSELLAKKDLTEEDIQRFIDLNDKLQARRDFTEDTSETPNYEKEPQNIEHPEPQTLDVGEQRLREIVKNYTPNVTEEQTDEILELLNARARSMGWDLDTYLNNTFQGEMAKYTTEDTATVVRDGKERTIRFKGNVDFAKDGKAIITLTQNADFTTWVHEIGHIFRKQIAGDMLAEAERYYEVKDGVWTEEQEERFTEDFTTYLRTRHAPNSTLEKMFRIIADALNDIYDRFRARGQVSDDIAKVFEEMLGDRQSAYNTQTSVEADYDTDSELYQIIGEQGAWALDFTDYANNELIFNRLENLQMAKSLEKLGESEKSIRLATGWEKGKDGKWRFEIPDVEIIHPLFKLSHEYWSKQDEWWKLEEKKRGIIGKEGITQNNAAQLDKINDQMHDITTDMKPLRDKYYAEKANIKAGQLYDLKDFASGAVMKAYPLVEGLKIMFDHPSKMKGANAYYSSNKNLIVFHEKFIEADPETFRQTLVHEIQHAIQEKERFFLGGNDEMFKKTTREALEIELSQLKTSGQEDKYNALKEKMERSNVRGAFNNQKFVDLAPYGIDEFVDPFEAYWRIAGEVEARNVTERLKYDKYQRRRMGLRKTEDVNRSAQINPYDENGRVIKSTQQISVDKLYQEMPTEQERAEAEAQYNEVVAKYKGTSEWLKAPNGQPTKLTERQWVQVRTPLFKAWFGDWENDPQNASKVVDENGEPLVVYHGTNADFDTFDTSRSSGMFMFTDDQALSEQIANNRNTETARVLGTFLNIRNPKSFDMDGYDWFGNGVGENEGKSINKGRKTNYTYLEATKAKREGFDGTILNNVTDTGIKSNHYIAFSPEQIKSATDNVGTFDETNPSILYQLYEQEEDTYRIATENGNYVPDYILTQMMDKDWVQDELEAREDFRKDALNYDSYEAFLEAQIKSGGQRKDKYYEQIWLTSESILPDYESMIPNLSRRMLERVLSTINTNVKYKRGLMPTGMLGEMVKKYAKKHMMSEEDFRALKDELASAPDKAITFISECFMNQDEFEKMMKSLWLHPDLEVEHIKELERNIRSDQHLAETRISKLEEKITDIKRRYRERELYKKLVRAIFKKPAKMCDVEIAMQIQAIQAGLSPTSMRETTRQKLELELMNTTDERRKAKIRNLMNRKSLRDMTLAEIAQVASMLTQMRHEGVQKRMEQLLAKQEERLGVIDGLGEDLNVDINLDRTGSVEARKDKGSLYDRMKGFWWDINRLAEDMGPHWKAFFAEKVSQAYEEELRNVARRRENLMAEMERLGITTETLSKAEEVEGAAEFLGEKTRTYTHDILLHWYICKQNEDSYSALLFGNFRGNGDNPAEMARIESVIDDGISRLSDAEIQLAEWMMNSFSGEDRGRLWEQFMKVENRCPEMVVRYFPMKKQLDHISDIQADPLVDLGERTPAGRVAVRKGFSWDRIHNINWQYQKPLKLGAMSIYLQAVQDQEHYIAFAQLSKDMKYCYEKVADKVISKYGRNFYDDLNKWIDRVINPNAYKARYNEQNIFLDALSNSVAASLAGNVVTMIKQVPSMLFFLPYCDVSSIAHSLHEFATDHKKMTEFAKEKSPYLKMRNMEDMLTKLSDQLADPNTKMRRVKQGMDMLLKPISWMDEFACVVGWNAVYAHEMSNGATEEAAVKKANEALLKTQPQAAAIFSPQAYNAGGFWRPFLVFTRQANQIWQMMTADMPRMVAEKEFANVIRMGFVLGLNALIMGWISRKFAGYGDDDDGVLKDMSKDIVANLSNNIPIIGPTLVGMMQRSAYTSSGYVNPMSDLLVKGYKAYNQVVDKKDIDFDTAMRYITDAMKPAGLPSVLTWRAYRALREEDIWYLMIGSPLGGNNGRK